MNQLFDKFYYIDFLQYTNFDDHSIVQSWKVNFDQKEEFLDLKQMKYGCILRIEVFTDELCLESENQFNEISQKLNKSQGFGCLR